jgi:pimeloyl-ACP methyl ester carboxylesterase
MLSGTLWCQDDLAGSSGSWPSATVDDLAADAAAAVAALRSQPMVDQNAVCLFGHSEGGWVALRCAVLARPRWLIVNSCRCRSGRAECGRCRYRPGAGSLRTASRRSPRRRRPRHRPGVIGGQRDPTRTSTLCRPRRWRSTVTEIRWRRLSAAWAGSRDSGQRSALRRSPALTIASASTASLLPDTSRPSRHGVADATLVQLRPSDVRACTALVCVT